MYTIIKQEDGMFRCEGRLQDSTETWYEIDLKKAIKKMKEFARYGNGMTITKRDIEIVEEFQIQVAKTEYRKYKA